MGCVDLTAPWVKKPRPVGFPTGGTPWTGGTPASGGTQNMDSSTNDDGPASGGMTAETGGTPVETGGALGGSGGQSIDATLSTGGIRRTGGAPSDAQTSTGGIALVDAPIATGGTAIVDAPIATGGLIATGGIASTGGTTPPDALVTTGGVITTGGAVISYNCASPYVLTGGTVTNFSDWNSTTSTWGSGTKLKGNVSSYQGGGASISPAKVEGTPLVGMHLVGTLPASSYAGGILQFATCTSVASYPNLAFDIYGKAPGCNLEVLVQILEQRPVDANPPGTCKADGGTNCYLFPGVTVNLESPMLSSSPSSPTVVTKALSELRGGLPTAKATQVVGLQWQFTPKTNPAAECYPDVTITNIRFQ